MKKIKVLKETPFNKEGAIISIKEFKDKYNYVFSSEKNDVFDEEIIMYLNKERECVLKSPETTASYPLIGTFFEVVDEKDPFKEGDWVWNEKLEEAYQVVKHTDDMWPNQCTINAANTYEVWKRKATQEEIEQSRLTIFQSNNITILVGVNRLYVLYTNLWKIVKYAREIITAYFEIIEKSNLGGVFKYPVNFNGVSVGCVVLAHNDLVQIANIMNIKIKK